jgi:hypothetical protein
MHPISGSNIGTGELKHEVQQTVTALKSASRTLDAFSESFAGSSVDAGLVAELRKALTQFDVSRKNAEAAVAKAEARGRTELAAAAAGGDPGAAEKQLQDLYNELVNSLRPLMQKAIFPLVELNKLAGQLRSDSKLGPSQKPKLSSVWGKELPIIEQSLHDLRNDFDVIVSTYGK